MRQLEVLGQGGRVKWDTSESPRGAEQEEAISSKPRTLKLSEFQSREDLLGTILTYRIGPSDLASFSIAQKITAKGRMGNY